MSPCSSGAASATAITQQIIFPASIATERKLEGSREEEEDERDTEREEGLNQMKNEKKKGKHSCCLLSWRWSPGSGRRAHQSISVYERGGEEKQQWYTPHRSW